MRNNAIAILYTVYMYATYNLLYILLTALHHELFALVRSPFHIPIFHT